MTFASLNGNPINHSSVFINIIWITGLHYDTKSSDFLQWYKKVSYVLQPLLSQHKLLGKSLAIFQGHLLAVYKPFTNQQGTCQDCLVTITGYWAALANYVKLQSTLWAASFIEMKWWGILFRTGLYGLCSERIPPEKLWFYLVFALYKTLPFFPPINSSFYQLQQFILVIVRLLRVSPKHLICNKLHELNLSKRIPLFNHLVHGDSSCVAQPDRLKTKVDVKYHARTADLRLA